MGSHAASEQVQGALWRQRAQLGSSLVVPAAAYGRVGSRRRALRTGPRLLQAGSPQRRLGAQEWLGGVRGWLTGRGRIVGPGARAQPRALREAQPAEQRRLLLQLPAQGAPGPAAPAGAAGAAAGQAALAAPASAPPQITFAPQPAVMIGVKVEDVPGPVRPRAPWAWPWVSAWPPLRRRHAGGCAACSALRVHLYPRLGRTSCCFALRIHRLKVRAHSRQGRRGRPSQHPRRVH